MRTVRLPEGVDVRDIYAMAAAMPIISRRMDGEKGDAEQVARWSYKIADAMLKEREKCVQ